MVRNVINNYRGRIHKNYIDMAQNILYELVKEKLEEISI